MRFILIFIFLLSSNSTFAKKKVVYRKTQTVNFSEKNIDGKGRSPDSSYIYQEGSVKFFPIYKVKKTMDKNIKDSIDYLR